MQKTIYSLVKVSLEMDVKNIFSGKSLGHLSMKPNQSIIGFNMELRIIESLIA